MTIEPMSRVRSLCVAGDTYAAIGKKVGRSREWVRLVFADATPEDRQARSDNVLARKRQAAVASILTIANKEPHASQLAIAQRVSHADIDLVTRTLAEAGLSRHVHRGSPAQARYSHEECVDSLKAAHKANGNRPMSIVRYNHLAEGPIAQTLMLRYGSWARALRIAGLAPPLSHRTEWARRWSDDEIVGWVRRFTQETPHPGTASGYEEWAKGVDGAPSLGTVRARLGKWADTHALAVAGADAA